MTVAVNTQEIPEINIKTIISKLNKNSYLFKWISEKVILEWLRVGTISILQFKPWVKMISEWDDDCRFFYLLLKWEVGIFKNSKKICTLNKISLIGELWFINPLIKRTATVITQETVVIMKFERGFVENLNPVNQLIIYKNMSEEMAHRLNDTNTYIDSLKKNDMGKSPFGHLPFNQTVFSLLSEK